MRSSVPLPDKAWQRIKHLLPEVSDDARKDLERCLAVCVEMKKARKSSPPAAQRAKTAKEYHDLAVKLATKLKKIDAATMMDVIDAATYRPDALALFVRGADSVLALAAMFKAATKKRPKKCKPGPDGETFELLVAQWNVIRQSHGTGPISRTNCDDVAVIAGIFTKSVGDPEIKAGKLDLAIKNVLARPFLPSHTDLSRTYIDATGKPITGTDKLKADRPIRVDAHPLHDVVASQMPDRATLAMRRTPKTELE
jgi:phosphotransferase system HPr-like phosphotransfer protein